MQIAASKRKNPSAANMNGKRERGKGTVSLLSFLGILVSHVSNTDPDIDSIKTLD